MQHHAIKCLLILIFFASFLSTADSLFWKKKFNYSPVIIVPGNGGCRIEAKTVNPKVPTPKCRVSRDWYLIWANIKNIDLFAGEYTYGCWEDYIRLQFNKTTGESHPYPGVHIRIPGWGTTETIEYVDPSWLTFLAGNTGAYFSTFVRKLLNLGYVRGKSIRGAPYDWRKAPVSHSDFFQRFKELIEDTYEKNGRKKVVLAAHSMGGTYTTYFLRRQTEAWKKKYVRYMLSLNVPYGGATALLWLYASGYNWGINFISAKKVRDEERTYESPAFMMPNDLAWNENDVVLITKDKKYTIKDYEEFFKDIGHRNGVKIWQRARVNTTEERMHPGVDIVCVYAYGLPTGSTLDYRQSHFPDEQPSVLHEDGDKTVTTRSMKVCEMWNNHPKHKFELKKFKGIGHNDLLYNEEFYAYLEKMLRIP